MPSITYSGDFGTIVATSAGQNLTISSSSAVPAAAVITSVTFSLGMSATKYSSSENWVLCDFYINNDTSIAAPYNDNNPMTGTTTTLSGTLSNPYTSAFTSTSISIHAKANCTMSTATSYMKAVSVTVNYETKPTLNQSYPANVSITDGDPTTLSVYTTSGVTPFYYQWYSGSSALTGQTSSSLTVSPSTTSTYYCIVSNAGGSATSRTATVTVAPRLPVLNSSYPQNTTAVCDGQAIFSVITTAGTTPMSYQWYSNDWLIPNATTATVTINFALVTTLYLKCIVTNAAGSVTSRTATVIVNPHKPVLSSTDPANKTVIIGTSTTLTCTPDEGSKPCTYQWYKGSTAIQDATSDTYTFTANETASYYCKVTNVSGTTQSRTAAITVNPHKPVLSSTYPANKTVIIGTSTTVSCVPDAGSMPCTYQWYKGGTAIQGATASTYTFTANETATYYCIVTNVTGSTQSRVATITVNPHKPVLSSAYPKDVVATVGTSTTLSCTPDEGSKPCTYQWYKNGTAIQGATSGTYTLTVSEAATYYCIVTNVSGSTQSRTATISLNGLCRIYANGSWVTATVYIYNGGAWHVALPYVYDSGSWHVAT